jgi:ubiquinone/menaquinone biosynthesis C-methylase UbiE
MSDNEIHYDQSFIAFLERMWGEGFLSPGGPEEVAELLEGVDLSGKSVLDIGCGAGGMTLRLARDHRAGKVIGVDVEPPVCERARRLVAAAGLEARVDIRQVEPGPIPLPDESQDFVVSKDAIVHIPDKEALARDIFRLLKPGGWFVASDWLIAHDGEPSPQMADYIAKEDLGFGMASPARYRRALESAGFADISFRNRNRWYLGVARRELARLEGPERTRFEAIGGPDLLAQMTATWRAMVPVLESGEHCPHHFRGRKP